MQTQRKENKMPGDINAITDVDVSQFESEIIHARNTSDFGNLMDLYQEIATKTAIYPGTGTPLGLAYVALKMDVEAGEFAEHTGKAMRDDGFIELDPTILERPEIRMVQFNGLTPERKEALLKEAGDVLWYLSAACNELGTTLSAVAVKNLEKLNDRTKRNKLSGSGDNR